MIKDFTHENLFLKISLDFSYKSTNVIPDLILRPE